MTVSLANLSDLAGGIRVRGLKLKVLWIQQGRPVTWEYRQFCEKQRCSLPEGLTHPLAPLIIPLNHPIRCRECGHVVGAEHADNNEDYRRLTVRGVVTEAWENCYPSEYEQICPVCEAHDPFDKMTVCAECDEYPCICYAENIE